jgi:UDP-N-acetylglucosamine--N-acetylmuramyl-(pentapeptide) pyrophosphoryl-undecaprenol N-acetylglucosamine transferase
MFDECRLTAKQFSGVVVTDFISNIDHAYAAADLIISRAGAIAISELCLVGKPVILVPFPFAAEDHQTRNAKALVKHHAAIHISDKDAPVRLIDEAVRLIHNSEERDELSRQIREFAIPDAAQRIVDEVIKMVNINDD